MRVRRLRRILAVAAALVAAIVIGGTLAINRIDPSDYRQTLAARVEATTGREFKIRGDITMAFGVEPAVTLNDMRLANASWAGAEPMIAAETVTVRIALLPLVWGELRLRHVDVAKPTIRLANRPDGAPNWHLPRLDGARQERARSNLLSGFERLTVRNATVTYAPRPHGAARRVDIPKLDGTRGTDGALDVRGTASIRGTSLSIRGTLGPPDLALVAKHHYPVDLSVTGFGGTAGVRGTVIDPTGARRLDVEVSLQSDDPRGLAKRLGFPAPRGDRLAVDADITGTNGRFAVRGLDLRLGSTEVTGRAVLDTKTRPNRLTGTLAAPMLDLRGLWSGTEETARRSRARVFGDTPLPWSLIDLAHADVQLRADTVKLSRRLKITDLNTHASLANGKLRLHTLTTMLAGGRVTATGRAAAGTPPRLEATIRADSLAYGRLLADAGITDAVTGTARVEADLTAHGRSPRALAASVSGNVSVIGSRGRVDRALVKAARAGLSDVLAPWWRTGNDVKLTCAVAKFVAKDGTLDSRVLLADTPTATIGGEGAVALGAERYDLRLVPKAKAPSLASLAVPVRVTGPLRDPRIGPAPEGAAKAGAIALGSLANPLATLGALVMESQMNPGNPCVAAIENARHNADSVGETKTNSNVEGSFFENLSQSIDNALGVEGNNDPNNEPVLPDEHGPSGR